MFGCYRKETKLEKKEEKVVTQACNKLKVNKCDFDLLVFDKMLFSFIFILLIKDKKVFLYNSDNRKKIEEFPVNDIDAISIQKKVDLNLYLKNGRMINLTSVVGVKPKVMNQVRELNNEINRLR